MKFVAALFLLMPLLVVAQEREMLTFQQNYSKLNYNDSSGGIQSTDLRVRLPLWNKDKHSLLAGVGYKQLQLNNFPGLYTRKLFGASMQLVWLYKASSTKNFAVMAQLGLFSDMKEISSKDTRYSLAFRYRIKHHKRLSTGWGIGYSRQFFGNQIIPFLDIDYHPNDKWTISGQFPVRPKILYHVSESLSVGAEIAGDASSYRLSEKEKNNAFIQIQQWTSSLLMEYRIAKSWQLRLGIGKNFKQSYRIYNDTQQAPWTIITIPIGKREDPIRRIDDKGVNMQLGISFNPFW